MHANIKYTAGLLTALLVMLVCFAASVMFGATNFHWRIAWDAAFHYDEEVIEQVIVRTTRMPRAFIAVAVGAALAIAGTLMQALTRNPLASPGVLGVNAGAALFVVSAAVIFSVSSMSSLMWISFAGAATGAVSVYALGSLGRDGLTPVKLILAGAAMTALFASMTQGLLVLKQTGLSHVLFWLTGTIAGRSTELLIAAAPYMAVCGCVAWLIARDINILVMGEDTAKGLGQRTVLIKALAGLIVVVLAGGAVSIAGPVGFIGVVIPHFSRFLAGQDHRWIIPYSALLGAILLLLADLAARFIMIPEEMPVGVMTALIGVPFFIYIARKGLGHS